MKQLDKKQVPQFVALCILSAGTFGYFVVRMVTPSPAAAGTRPQPVVEAAKPAPAATQTAVSTQTSAANKPATDAAAASVPDDAAVAPPTPGMRDPFVVGYVDPKTVPPGPAPAAPPTPALTTPALTTAALPTPAKAVKMNGRQVAGLPPAPVAAPFAPALPMGMSSFPVRPGASFLPAAPKALPPAPPPAPVWTVTGVLQSETEQIAILRHDDARRIVRAGDFADSIYRVVDVTRSTVTLRHGKTFYLLTLGAAKAVPVQAPPATFSRLPAAASPVSHVPGSLSRPDRTALAGAGKGLKKLARTWLASVPAAACPAVFNHVRDTDTDDITPRFLDTRKENASAEDAL